MFFRAPKIPVILLCLIAYFPVLIGEGECVAVCIKQDASVSLDYQHRCGKEIHSSSSSISVASFSNVASSQQDSCSDIPLVTGALHLTVTSSTPVLKHIPVTSAFVAFLSVFPALVPHYPACDHLTRSTAIPPSVSSPHHTIVLIV